MKTILKDPHNLLIIAMEIMIVTGLFLANYSVVLALSIATTGVVVIGLSQFHVEKRRKQTAVLPPDEDTEELRAGV